MSRAVERPDDLVIIEGSLELTNRQFANRVVQFEIALRALGVGAGTIVGIEARDRWVHWALILACEIIGATTTSFSAQHCLDASNPIAGICDFVFSSVEYSGPVRRRAIVFNDQWINAFGTIKVARFPEIKIDPAAVSRICSTSGTTSLSKAVALTNRVVQARVKSNVLMIRKHLYLPRHISFHDFSNVGMFASVSATLHMGGVMIFCKPDEFYSEIVRCNANFSLMVAGDLEQIVSSAPADFVKPTVFGIDIRGGGFSAALRRHTMQVLASNLNEVYGITETGNIASAEDENGKVVLPGVELRIQDEAGKVVAAGEVGTIWVKSETIVAGYWDQPELTASTFREGWFNTRDLGSVSEAGVLTVLGRSDDLLNIGGTKLAPHAMERSIRSIAGVREAVIVSVVNENGIGYPCAAVEGETGINEADIGNLMKAGFSRYTGQVFVVVLPSLPRGNMGKIIRREAALVCRKALEKIGALAGK